MRYELTLFHSGKDIPGHGTIAPRHHKAHLLLPGLLRHLQGCGDTGRIPNQVRAVHDLPRLLAFLGLVEHDQELKVAQDAGPHPVTFFELLLGELPGGLPHDHALAGMHLGPRHLPHHGEIIKFVTARCLDFFHEKFNEACKGPR